MKLDNKKKTGVLYRAFEVDKSSINLDTRTATVSFASEKPYKRSFGWEILKVDAEAIVTERLDSRAPLLFNHNPDNIIGVVEGYKIGDDRRAYAEVRFGKTQEAEDKFNLFNDGILPNTSFKYEILDMERVADIDGVPAYLVKKYIPIEVSLVSEPADTTTGAARFARSNEFEITDETLEQILPKEVTEQVAQETVAEVTPVIDETAIPEVKEDEGQVTPEPTIEVVLETEQVVIEEKAAEIQEQVAPTIIIKKEEKSMNTNFLQVINSIVNKDGKTTEFMSRAQEHAKVHGLNIAGNGILLSDIAVRAGEQVAGTPAAGGYIVPKEYRGDMFLDYLRNSLVLHDLGATFMTANSPFHFPRATGESNAADWVDENGDAIKTNITFGQTPSIPRRLAAFIQVSKRLINQGTPDAEAYFQKKIMEQLVSGIQKAAFTGSGLGNTPAGILTVAGTQSKAFVGTKPTRTEVVAMEGLIEDANLTASGFVMSPLFKSGLRTVEESASTAKWLYEAGQVLGYKAAVTKDIPNNKLIFGKWDDLAIVNYGMADIVIDEVTNARQNLLNITVSIDADVIVLRPESFVIGTTA